MNNLYLSIIIVVIYGIYLQQRRKVEGFAIIQGIRKMAKLLNNVRKIMKKMNKGIFKQLIKLNKKTKTFKRLSILQEKFEIS